MSYAMGATAGLIGDRWSLGFVSETENQVVKHLESTIRCRKATCASHS